MPYTFNGIGTRYIGCYDPLPDGTYITTKWFEICLPIIPIESYRVRSRSTKLSISFFPLFSSTTDYILVQTLERIYLKGVVTTYAFYISIIICMILAGWLEKSWLQIIPIIVIAVIMLTYIINESRKLKTINDAMAQRIIEKIKATVSEREKLLD